MARIEAWRDAAATAQRAGRTPVASVTLAVLGLIAIAALFTLTLQGWNVVQPIVLGLLALLAVAGVFLVLGLLGGFLRLSEAKDLGGMGQDGRRRHGRCHRDHRARRRRRLPQQGARAPGRRAHRAGMRRWRKYSPASRNRRRPSTGSTARPSARRRATRSSTCARNGWPAGADAGCACRCAPSARHRAAASRSCLTLWQVRDVTHERVREIETVGSLRSTLQFYDDLPQGLFAVSADGRILHLNATLAHWLGLRPELGQAADARRHRVGRRRGPDPRRGARRPRDAAEPRSRRARTAAPFPRSSSAAGIGRAG